MKIDIKIPKLKALVRNLEKYPELSAKHVDKAIRRALVRVWANEKLEAPVGVTTALRDNWTLTSGGLKGLLRSNTPYSAAVQSGSRPHAPNMRTLIPWAKKKGLNPWAVANSIKKKGTKANPFLTRALDRSEDGVKKEFSVALNDIMKELSRI